MQNLCFGGNCCFCRGFPSPRPGKCTRRIKTEKRVFRTRARVCFVSFFLFMCECRPQMKGKTTSLSISVLHQRRRRRFSPRAKSHLFSLLECWAKRTKRAALCRFLSSRSVLIYIYKFLGENSNIAHRGAHKTHGILF
jgi:hypothetical protein